MPLELNGSACKLKVTMKLDVARFVALTPIKDNAPPRTLLSVEVAGHKLQADVATRSLRRVVAAISELGPDGMALVLQGSAVRYTIKEFGLAAMPKAKPAVQTPAPADAHMGA
jgi:hypothetical protein